MATIEDYNKENSNKFTGGSKSEPTLPTRRKPSKNDNKKGNKKEKKKEKKKSSILKAILIYIVLVIVILAVIFVGVVAYNKIRVNQTSDKLADKYAQVEDKYPIKENIVEDILTNDYALENMPGEEIGYVKLPEQDMIAPIYQPVGLTNKETEDVMNFSIGHEATSYLPGEGHQIVLSGHREEQFSALKDVQEGDPAVVVIGQNVFVYEVYEIGRVAPSGDEALETVRGYTEEEELVMYTCYPFVPFTPVSERQYVKAKRVEEFNKASET